MTARGPTRAFRTTGKLPALAPVPGRSRPLPGRPRAEPPWEEPTSVREELVTARRERARLEKFAVRQEKGARSEYRVASHTGYSYSVVLRSLTERVNSCDCPDFRSNLLGTCKHIEAVLLRLRDRRNRTLRFRPPPKGRAEIYVEY